MAHGNCIIKSSSSTSTAVNFRSTSVNIVHSSVEHVDDQYEMAEREIARVSTGNPKNLR